MVVARAVLVAHHGAQLRSERALDAYSAKLRHERPSWRTVLDRVSGPISIDTALALTASGVPDTRGARTSWRASGRDPRPVFELGMSC